MDQVNKIVGIIIAVVVGSILIGSTAPMMVDRLTTSQATDDIDGLNDNYNEFDLTNNPDDIDEELADEFGISYEYLGYVERHNEVEESDIVTFDEIGVEAEMNELTNVNDGDDIYANITLSSVETGEEIETVEFEYPDDIGGLELEDYENMTEKYEYEGENYQIFATGVNRDGDGDVESIPLQSEHDESAASVKDLSHGYLYVNADVWYYDQGVGTNIKYYDNDKNVIVDDYIIEFDHENFTRESYDGYVENTNTERQSWEEIDGEIVYNQVTAEYTVTIDYEHIENTNMSIILIGIFVTFIIVMFRLATNQEY